MPEQKEPILKSSELPTNPAVPLENLAPEDPLKYYKYHWTPEAYAKRESFIKSVVSALDGKVMIFGEHHPSPRNKEIEKYIKEHSGEFSHLVLEMRGGNEYEEPVNKFIQGETVDIDLEQQSFKEYKDLIRFTKEYNEHTSLPLQIIAGAVSHDDIAKWREMYPDAAREFEGRYSDFWIAICPYGTKVVAEKIKAVLQKDPSATFIISCGVAHVEFFLRYLQDTQDTKS